MRSSDQPPAWLVTVPKKRTARFADGLEVAETSMTARVSRMTAALNPRKLSLWH